MKWHPLDFHPNATLHTMPEMRRLLSEYTVEEFDKEMLAVTTDEDLKLYWMIFCRWYACGGQVFVLDHNTVDLLVNTRISPKHLTLTPPPYPTYYIHLGNYEGTCTDSYLRGLLVCWTAEGDDNLVTGVTPSGCLVHIVAVHTLKASGEEMTVVGQAPFHQDMTAEDLHYLLWKTLRLDKDGPLDVRYDAMHVAFNFLPFIAYRDTETSTVTVVPRKRKRLLERLKHAKPGSRKRERLEDQLREAPAAITVTHCRDTKAKVIDASAVEQNDSESTRRRSWTRRHWVRGHWRMARVGKGRKETRRTWIRPHLRGYVKSATADLRIYDATGNAS